MKSGRSSWLGVAAYSLVAVIVVVFGVLLQQNRGSDWAYLWAVGIALAIIQVISVVDLWRMRRVRLRVPGATVALISVYEQFTAQLDALRGFDGVTVGRLPRRTAHCVVEVTPQSLSVWSGTFAPRPTLQIPGSRIGNPVLQKTQQGSYRLSSVRVPMLDGPGEAVLDLCALDWRFVFPAVASVKLRKELAGAIHRMAGSATINAGGEPTPSAAPKRNPPDG